MSDRELDDARRQGYAEQFTPLARRYGSNPQVGAEHPYQGELTYVDGEVVTVPTRGRDLIEVGEPGRSVAHITIGNGMTAVPISAVSGMYCQGATALKGWAIRSTGGVTLNLRTGSAVGTLIGTVVVPANGIMTFSCEGIMCNNVHVELVAGNDLVGCLWITDLE